MKKDFIKWHSKKEKINKEKKRPYFHCGEIWFCALGVNVGYEQDGKGESFLRPIIIVKKFNQEIFWGIPLTKHHKQGEYYFSFSLKNKDDKKSSAILSQIRLIDGKRLHYKIDNISEQDLIEMKKRLARLLA